MLLPRELPSVKTNPVSVLLMCLSTFGFNETDCKQLDFEHKENCKIYGGSNHLHLFLMSYSRFVKKNVDNVDVIITFPWETEP